MAESNGFEANNNPTSAENQEANLPPTRLSRHYRCDKCPMTTTRSRVFLYHHILDHSDQTNVFLCAFCDYASRWRCKVTRHQVMLHKDKPQGSDVVMMDAKAIRERFAGRSLDQLHNIALGGGQISVNGEWSDVDDEEASYDCLTPTVTNREDTATPAKFDNQCTNCQFQFESNNFSQQAPMILHNCAEGTFLCKSCQFCCRTESEALLHATQHRRFAKGTDIQSNLEAEPTSESSHSRDHQQQQMDGIMCICPVCGHSAPTPVQLDEHMENAHEENSTHALVDVHNLPSSPILPLPPLVSAGTGQDDSFASPSSPAGASGSLMISTDAGSDSRRRYRCNACPATFPWHGDLAEHMRLVHGMQKTRDGRGKAGNFRCTHCKYVAKYQSELRRHMRLHLGVKPFGCVFCSYRSAWKGDLKRHIESHHRECFSSDMELCKIMAQYKNNAGTDLTAGPLDADPQGSLQHSPSLDGAGQVSPGSIQSDSNMNLSEEDSISILPPLLDEQRSPSVERKRGPDREIGGGSKLDKSPGRLPCPHCHYMAQNQSKLNNHMASHSNLRLFRCPICGQRSNYKWDVRKHIKSQHPEAAHLDVEQISPGTAALSGANSVDVDEVEQQQQGNHRHLSSPALTARHVECSPMAFGIPVQGRELSPTSPDITFDDVARHAPRQMAGIHSPPEARSVPPGLWHACHPTMRPTTAALNLSAASNFSDSTNMLYLQQQLLMASLMQNFAHASPVSVPPPPPIITAPPLAPSREHVDRSSPSFIQTKLAENYEAFSHKDEMNMETNSDVSSDRPLSITGTGGGLASVAGKQRKNHTPLSLIKEDQWKRYKCSGCGHRSNWKWDINKHIKVAHPERNDINTVMLSIEEARSTLHNYLASTKGSKTRAQGSNDMDEGYYRPFKCSVCGHRSNWKWDVNKHIKQVHECKADVITMPMEEAKQTITLYKSRRRQAAQAQAAANMIGSVGEASSSAAAGSTCDSVNQSPMGANADQSIGGPDGEQNCSLNLTRGTNREMSSTSLLVQQGNPRVDLLRLKRFRCSVCGYRSNYRSDIARHNRRKHRAEGRIQLMQEEEARTSLPIYVTSFPQRSNALFRKSLDGNLCEELDKSHLGTKRGVYRPYYGRAGAGAVSQIQRKFWKCAVCSYFHREKAYVVRHITQLHKPTRPFACRLCNYGTDYRNSLIRHIRTKHVAEGCEQYVHQNMRKIRCRRPSHPALEPSADPEANLPSGSSALTPSSEGNNLGGDASAVPVCVVCGAMFSNLHDLIVHSADRHSSTDEEMYMLFNPGSGTTLPIPFHCPLCPFTTKRSAVADIHKVQHSAECHFTHRCQVCGYRASSEKFLQNHKRQHLAARTGIPEDLTREKVPIKVNPSIEQDEPYDLSISSSSGKGCNPSTTDVIKSEQVDGPKKQLHSCRFCPYFTFDWKRAVLHRQGHRPIKSKSVLACSRCTFSTGNLKRLTAHAAVHKATYEEARRRQHKLTAVKERYHDLLNNNSDAATPVANGGTSGSNNLVPAMVKTLESLRLTLGKYGKQGDQPPGHLGYANRLLLRRMTAYFTLGSVFACDECPQILSSAEELDQHIRCHGPRSANPLAAGGFVCGVCDFVALTPPELFNHQMLHMDDGKSSNPVLSAIAHPLIEQNIACLKNILHENLLILPQPPIYTCPECPYLTDSADKFLLHRSYHSAEQTQRCPLCSYAHSHAQGLARHMLYHEADLQSSH